MKIDRSIFRYLSLVLIAFLLVSCGKKVVISDAEYKVDPSQPTFELPLGKVATISLEENATTGYTWHYLVDDESVLSFLSEETKTTTSDEKIVGAPTIHTWKFTADKAGTTTLKFAYCREWEAKALEAVDQQKDPGNNPRFPRLKAFKSLWEASIEKKEYTISVK